MNYFVFVVCGAKEHIQTLNYSLKFICHFSKYPVLVVTDVNRNEIPVEHNHIINITTPEQFDHHQASIYLKTGLNKFLDMNEKNLYCYLDSDIVAINSEINTIFDFFKSPVIFAKDHCPFSEFSPYAVNCSCLDDTLKRNLEYAAVDNFFMQKFFKDVELNRSDKLLLDAQFEDIKKQKIKNIFTLIRYLAFRYILPVKNFKFGDFYFNKKDKFWYNKSNEIIHFDYRFFANDLYDRTGVYFDKKTKKWLNKKGEDITPKTPECTHLTDYIKTKYNISVNNKWRHWNGGVFLFNANAEKFMDYWHNITLNEFENPLTKTRDQGTLAVSAWKFGLQDSDTLPEKFNFITEFNNPNIAFSEEKGFTHDGFKTIFNPCFLHIYHQWGHAGWSIWDYVTSLESNLK